MDKTTLIASLNTLGITPNTWTSSDDLMSINLINNGNHFYNQFEQMIFFDTTNELVKIKHYFYGFVSSEFFKAEKIAPATIKADYNINNRYSINNTPIMEQFRNPEVGDYVYTILASDRRFVEARTITGISAGVLTLDSDIDTTNKILCYASGKSIDLVGGTFFTKDAAILSESFAGDDAFIYLKRPVTDYAVDTYISTRSIDGFSLRRFNTKEALLYR